MSPTERAMMPTVSRALGVDPHAGRRKQPKARLEPDDAAIGRRPDHRAAGLRADRQRHHEIGDRRRRAARRAARREARGCAGSTSGRDGGWRTRSSRSCRAGCRRPRAAATRRWRRSSAGSRHRSASRSRSACRRVSKMSLMPNGTPRSSAVCPPPACRRPARPRAPARAVEMAPGAHHRLALADPLEAALDDGLGGQLAGFDRAGRASRREAMRFGVRHRQCSVRVRGAGTAATRSNPAPPPLPGEATSPSPCSYRAQPLKGEVAEALRRRADRRRCPAARLRAPRGRAAPALLGEAEQPVDPGEPARVEDRLLRERLAARRFASTAASAAASKASEASRGGGRP